MGTNLFAWHGFIEVLLDGRLRKASPTFNSTLCTKFGVAPRVRRRWRVSTPR